MIAVRSDRGEHEVGPERVLRQLHPDPEALASPRRTRRTPPRSPRTPPDPQAREERRQRRRPAQPPERLARPSPRRTASGPPPRATPLRNPSSSATTIGKNVTSTTTSTFGASPNPNHSRNSGAIATTGIVWRRDEERLDRPPDDPRPVHRRGRRDRQHHRDREAQRRSRRASGRGGGRRRRGSPRARSTIAQRAGQHDGSTPGEPDVRLPGDEDRQRRGAAAATRATPASPGALTARQEGVREQRGVVGRRGQRLARSRPRAAPGRTGSPSSPTIVQRLRPGLALRVHEQAAARRGTAADASGRSGLRVEHARVLVDEDLRRGVRDRAPRTRSRGPSRRRTPSRASGSRPSHRGRRRGPPGRSPGTRSR